MYQALIGTPFRQGPPRSVPAVGYFGIQGHAETQVTIELVFASGSLTVNWGDGNIETITTATPLTHNYSPAYTGPIKIKGDVDEVTEFYITAGNVSFTMASLQVFTALTILEIYGDNTTTGSIAGLPATLEQYINEGENTTSGNISSMPAGLLRYTNAGNNTVNGNLDLTPANITYIVSEGNSAIATYTTKVWAADMDAVISNPVGTGLTTAEVDALLIDLAATTWLPTGVVELLGDNEPRSAASDAAVTTIEAFGATVATN